MKRSFSPSKITHYANHRLADGFLASPENLDQLREYVIYASKNGLRLSALGTQNSFSDIFLNDGQLHLSILKINRIILFDPAKKLIVVEPGVQVWQILQLVMPQGFYLTGLSGSYTDTLSGMISSNSFGKDSWRNGNCGENVLSIKLMVASGEIIEVNQENPLFDAVIGGLGTLGIITEIWLELKPLPSFNLEIKNNSILIKHICDFPKIAPLQYVWLDMSGQKNPRFVHKTATFCEPSIINDNDIPPPNLSILGLSPKIFWKTIRIGWRPSTYKVANTILYLGQIANIRSMYYSNWISYYYPFAKFPMNCHIFKDSRFYEWQVLFDLDKFETVFNEINSLMRKFKIYPIAPSIRWHKPSKGHLTFAGLGISLLVSFEAYIIESDIGQKFKSSFFELVFMHGGKTYLSKYPYFSNREVILQYPKINSLVQEKKHTDPNNLFLTQRTAALLNIDI